MSDILTGIVKGLSGFMPQDDPDVKIFNAQTEIKELAEKTEKVYARLGRHVYESGGSESYPEVKAELDLLTVNRRTAEHRLQEAKEEKAARERAIAEEQARREAQEATLSCPNCGAEISEGSRFCGSCGTKVME